MCNVYLTNDFATNVFNTVYILRNRIASGECLNFVTGKTFGNRNSEILTTESELKKYPSNCWATFKQIQSIGGSVKGQHGITITLVMKKEETEEEKELKPLKEAEKTIIKRITVFNLSQIHDARLDKLTKEEKADLNDINLGDLNNLATNLQAVDLKIASIEVENKMKELDNGIKAIENKKPVELPIIEVTEVEEVKPIKKATTKTTKKATSKKSTTKKPSKKDTSTVDPIQKAIDDFDNYVAGL